MLDGSFKCKVMYTQFKRRTLDAYVASEAHMGEGC